MTKKRAGMAAITTDFGIFVVGGIQENFEVTSTCELYNVAEDIWTEMSSMSEPSMNASLCVWQSTKVLKFGGQIHEELVSQKIELFDLLSDSWSTLHVK